MPETGTRLVVMDVLVVDGWGADYALFARIPVDVDRFLPLYEDRIDLNVVGSKILL